MNIKKYIKQSIITLAVISSTVIGYAAISNVSTGETLTANLFNTIIDQTNTNESNIININNGTGFEGIILNSQLFDLTDTSTVYTLPLGTKYIQYDVLCLNVHTSIEYLATAGFTMRDSSGNVIINFYSMCNYDSSGGSLPFRKELKGMITVPDNVVELFFSITSGSNNVNTLANVNLTFMK